MSSNNNYKLIDIKKYLYEIHADYLDDNIYLQTLYNNNFPNKSPSSYYGIFYDRIDEDDDNFFNHYRSEPFGDINNKHVFVLIIVILLLIIIIN